MICQVVEAKAQHIGYVVRRLRAAHAAYFASMGVNAHRSLRDAFLQSSFRRTWMVDGVPAAVGGVSGMLLSSSGIVWLAMTEAATRMPVAAMREARRQMATIMATHTDVESALLLCDPASWRFAAALGFFVKTQDGARVLTSESRRKPLGDILRSAPEFRISLPGAGDGVLIGYQGARDG